MRMPALFVGHGSPMNAIEDNGFTREWEGIARRMPRPEAILSVSAHWFVAGCRVSDAPRPRMIHDMYGFPEELYKVAYPAPGAPEIARRARALLGEGAVIDNGWGIDHGTWSVLCRAYPEADIPVFQVSVDRDAAPEEHYRRGRALRALRDEGVLIFGSGNIVHNLGRVDWNHGGGYPWAEEFDNYVRRNILDGRHENVIRYRRCGESANLAVPMLDHFSPLLYVLGAAHDGDDVSIFNAGYALGSLSMTSILLG